MSKQSGTDVVSLENTRFNESVNTNPQGSVFLGYLYAELVVQDVFGDEDLKIGMPDLQVRITRSGKPRVDFPLKRDDRGRFVENRDGNPVASYFTASRATRELLTKLVFALPAVSRAVERSERTRQSA